MASLNVLYFLYHSGSFQNRRTGWLIFPFVGVFDCFVCWMAFDKHVFRVFLLKRDFVYQYILSMMFRE